MKRYIYLSIIVCGLILAYFFLKGKNKKTDKNIENPILQENQKEKIIIDQKKHQAEISEVGRHTRTVYLNPRGAVAVIENKDGTITIQQRTWGAEHAPVIGISYSDNARVDVGVALFYIHSFDCGIGLSTRYTPLAINGMAFLGWNFRESLLLYGKYDTDKRFGLGVGYRF